MQLLQAPNTLSHLRHDGQLLHQFAAGHDESAFVEILRRHGAMVLGVCRRVLHHQQDAEDATQAVFLSLAQQANKLAGTYSLAAWLHCVARRTAGYALRQAQKRQRREHQAARPEALTTQDADAVRWLLDEELDRLPQRYRLPVLLCCVEGHTRQTASQLLGWPPGTVAGRLARARAILQKRLTARGVALAAAAGVLMPSGVSALSSTLMTLLSSQAGLISQGKTLTEFITPGVAAMMAGMTVVSSSARISLAILTSLMLLAGGWVATLSVPAKVASSNPLGFETSRPETEQVQPLFAGTVWADGKTVAGAKVWLSTRIPGQNDKVMTTNTDQQGRFSFSPDFAASTFYNLYARSSEGGFQYVDGNTLSRTPNWRQLHIELLPACQATGKLLDHEGQPMAGVAINTTSLYFGDFLNAEDQTPLLWTNRSRSMQGVPEFLQNYWKTTTRDDGSFTIPALPDQCTLLTSIMVKPNVSLVVVLNSKLAANIKLPAPSRILVRQVDVENALQLRGAEFKCSSFNEDPNYRCIQHLAATMDNKPLMFDPVYAGKITTITQESFGASPAYLEESKVVEARPGQTTEVTLKAKAGVKVKGRVVQEGTNKPLPETKVNINTAEVISQPHNQLVKTNKEGYYEGYATPGRVRSFLVLPLQGLINDARCTPVQLKGETGQSITMPDLVVKESKTIEGEVMALDGKPVPKANLYSFATFRDRNSVQTDAQGKFTINNLADDVIALFARNEDAVVSEPMVVDLTIPQQKIKLTLDPKLNFFITGRFVNRQGKPQATTPVQLAWKLRGTGQLSMMSTTVPLMDTTTDSDGRFRFGPLWPGQLYVVKHQSNQLAAFESSQILGKAGESLSLGNVIIEQSNSIVEGRVVDTQGQPLAGVVITNRADGPKLSRATTDAQGRFTLNGLYDKEAWVVARQEGYHLAASPVDLTSGKGNVTMTLKSLRERSDLPKIDLTRDYQQLADYLFSKLLAMPAEKLNGHHPTVLRELARYQPAAAQAWLAQQATQDSKTYGPASVYALCLKEGLAFHDALHGAPVEAQKRLKTIDIKNRAYWLLRNLPTFIKLAPASARQLFPNFVADCRELPERDHTLYLAAASHLAWKMGDEAQAKSLAEEAFLSAELFSTETERKCYTRHSAAAAIIRFDQAKAMQLIEPIKLINEGWYFRALEDCIPPLGERDLPAAVNLMKELNTPDARFTRPIAEIKLVMALAPKHPEEAEKFARSMSTSDARIEALLWLARAFGIVQPAAASRCLEEAYRQLDADRLEQPPMQMSNYRYRPWQLAGLGAAIAAELKHPQQADWSALVVAHRGTIRDGSPIGKMEGQVSAARLLALSDPLTTRQLLAEAVPVESKFGAGTWGFYRPDWLFAQALADPQEARVWIDLTIERLNSQGNNRDMGYGLIELAQILASPPTLQLGATLANNNQFYLGTDAGKP